MTNVFVLGLMVVGVARPYMIVTHDISANMLGCEDIVNYHVSNGIAKAYIFRV